MKNPFIHIKKFTSSFGLVEQSQVVASTAVIVLMMTILSINIATGQDLRWVDFTTLITVGIFGFLIVFFISKYGLQINEQHRQLLALNTIAQAVSHSVELKTVLQNSLEKVVDLLNSDGGWIYLVENDTMELKHSYKIQTKILPDQIDIDSKLAEALRLNNEPSQFTFEEEQLISERFFRYNIPTWASLPLELNSQFVGTIIIASKDSNALKPKQLELLQAFRNQISVALNNAYLFEQMKQSERLYADLYENLPDMYHSVNPDGIIVSCNKTELDHLGFTKEEIIGEKITKLYPSEYHELILHRIKEIFNTGVDLKGIEEIMETKSGTLINVSVNTSIVYNSERKPVLVRMVARDITKQKLMEEKIIQAQKIDSIGNLAGGVAHDFNNILNSILGPASMMKRKLTESDKFYKYISLIEDSARRGASVTRQLLTFSRKSNVYFRNTNINKIISETVHLFERSIPKSTQVKWTPSKEILIVHGDEGQLEQALLNLLINSQAALPNGGIITVLCKSITTKEHLPAAFNDVPPGNYVVIKVIDNGTGITKDIILKIFEPFFTTKDQSKGTGLGLSVVYGVVRNHEGYISVESEIGVGTAFTIYLSRIEKIDDLEKDKAAENVVGGSERVLIVDDDIGANVVGGDILRELGYKVDLSQDGFQAIEKFQNNNIYDLVVLDLNMPGISGKEVFYRLKKLKPSIKILICSGYSDTILNDDDFIKSIDGYLHKPYMYEELAKSVRDAIDKTTI